PDRNVCDNYCASPRDHLMTARRLKEVPAEAGIGLAREQLDGSSRLQPRAAPGMRVTPRHSRSMSWTSFLAVARRANPYPSETHSQTGSRRIWSGRHRGHDHRVRSTRARFEANRSG